MNWTSQVKTNDRLVQFIYYLLGDYGVSMRSIREAISYIQSKDITEEKVLSNGHLAAMAQDIAREINGSSSISIETKIHLKS